MGAQPYFEESFNVTAPAFTTPFAGRPALVSVAPAADARTEFLRRAAGFELDPSGVLALGSLELDTDAYTAAIENTPVELSPRQVELLAVFLSAPGRVWSREQLHWICWGDTTPSRRVDVQLCRIRTKLGLDLFRNIRDRGWTLQAI